MLHVSRLLRRAAVTLLLLLLLADRPVSRLCGCPHNGLTVEGAATSHGEAQLACVCCCVWTIRQPMAPAAVLECQLVNMPSAWVFRGGVVVWNNAQLSNLTSTPTVTHLHSTG